MDAKDKILTNISESIIANQLALDLNHKIRFTGYYKHELKKHLKLTNKYLIEAEKKEFDQFFDIQEKATNELYAANENIVKEIASLGITHYNNLTEIIKAYKKDMKSIQGIVNKINNR